MPAPTQPQTPLGKKPTTILLFQSFLQPVPKQGTHTKGWQSGLLSASWMGFRSQWLSYFQEFPEPFYKMG